MRITITDLKRDTRTIEVEYEGQSAEVTYRPSAYTPNMESQYLAMLRENRIGGAVAFLLSRVLESWEIVDENGAMYPIDEESLGDLQTDFLSTVVAAISADLRAEAEARKNSGAGSSRGARSEARRTSTFS